MLLIHFQQNDDDGNGGGGGGGDNDTFSYFGDFQEKLYSVHREF